MKLLSGIFRTESQTLRGTLAEALVQALQQLTLHQIQLLGPDGIRAAHSRLSAALGYRAGDRRDPLADDLGPSSLQGRKGGFRRRLLERGAQGRRSRARSSAAVHAAADASARNGIRTAPVSAEAGSESSAAAVISV